MKFNRRDLGRYIRVVTGHNNLLYHRNNIDPINNDSMCRFCSEDVETFIHFTTDCPARWRERRDNLLVYVGDSMMPWQPQQLLDFAYTSEISQLLEMQYDTESDSEEANEPMEVDTVNSTADASETGNSTEADSD